MRNFLSLGLAMSMGALVAIVPSAGCDDGGGAGGAGTEGGSTTASATTSSGSTSTTTTGTASSGTSSSTGTGGMAVNPHPLYPALDLDDLPGPGGAASGPYTPPTLPATTSMVTVSGTGAQARQALQAACQTAGTAVTVPDSAGNIGFVDIGNATDCDITFGAAVVLDGLYLGHLPGPQIAPVHRIRVRGGQLGAVIVDPGSTDIALDGVVINSGVVPSVVRTTTGILLNGDASQFVDRFAVVNSIIRLVATNPDGNGNTDGNAYLGARARNVFFANDNVVTAGNRNAWGFRIGGGDNFLIVDSTVRVSFHKLIRMNDGPVDYVWVKGGTWMRQATPTAMGMVLNDSFAQLGDAGTDHVYIHDPVIHLLPTVPVSFGATAGMGQVGKSWEARNMAWHATSSDVVSDAILTSYQSGCAAGATCDYGVGTHTYQYDPNLSLPADAWRALPSIAADDPDDQPTVP